MCALLTVGAYLPQPYDAHDHPAAGITSYQTDEHHLGPDYEENDDENEQPPLPAKQVVGWARR